MHMNREHKVFFDMHILRLLALRWQKKDARTKLGLVVCLRRRRAACLIPVCARCGVHLAIVLA